MQPQATPSRHEVALTKLALCIREFPETSGGVQLRQFLWSLYNQHHLINLWTFVSRLDTERSHLACEVLTAALVGKLQENDIKRALLVAGEMDRWDRALLAGEGLVQLGEAVSVLQNLVRQLPPGRAHTELVEVLQRLREVREGWNLGSH